MVFDYNIRWPWYRLVFGYAGDTVLEAVKLASVHKVLIVSLVSEAALSKTAQLLQSKFPSAHIGIASLDGIPPGNQGDGGPTQRLLLRPTGRCMFQHVGQLRSARYDLVVLLTNNYREPLRLLLLGWLVCVLSGARQRVGFSCLYTFTGRTLAPYLFDWYSRMRVSLSRFGGYAKAVALRVLLAPVAWYMRRRMRPKTQKKILVLMEGGIGDIVMAVPALRSLRKAHPYAHITCIVPAASVPLLELCPYSNNVLVKTKRLLPRAFSIVKDCYDISVNLSRQFQDAFFPYVAHVPERIGPFGRYTRMLRIQTHEVAVTARHHTQQLLDITRGMGISTADTHMELWVPDEVARQVDERLSANGVKAGDVIVGVHPGAGGVAKVWPAAKFAQLADAIADRPHVSIVLTGGPREAPVVNDVLRRMRRPALVLTDLSLLELVAVIKRMRLLIGNDAGPVHIAVAVGTPVVSIWGQTSPEYVGHPGKTSILLGNTNTLCSLRSACDTYRSYGHVGIFASNPWFGAAVCSSYQVTCTHSVPMTAVRQAAESLLRDARTNPPALGARAARCPG